MEYEFALNNDPKNTKEILVDRHNPADNSRHLAAFKPDGSILFRIDSRDGVSILTHGEGYTPDPQTYELLSRIRDYYGTLTRRVYGELDISNLVEDTIIIPDEKK